MFIELDIYKASKNTLEQPSFWIEKNYVGSNEQANALYFFIRGKPPQQKSKEVDELLYELMNKALYIDAGFYEEGYKYKPKSSLTINISKDSKTKNSFSMDLDILLKRDELLALVSILPKTEREEGAFVMAELEYEKSKKILTEIEPYIRGAKIVENGDTIKHQLDITYFKLIT